MDGPAPAMYMTQPPPQINAAKNDMKVHFLSLQVAPATWAGTGRRCTGLISATGGPSWLVDVPDQVCSDSLFGTWRRFLVADDMASQHGAGGTPRDRTQLDELVPLVYAQLRQLAARQLQNERTDHTLQTTALAHEAYLKLAGQHRFDGAARQQVLGLAALIMRRILTDHARRRAASKRSAHRVLVSTGKLESLVPASPPSVDLLALDDALTQLARFDARQARIVELRFFGGLTFQETAGELGISLSTAKREWVVAKAWLFRELGEARADG